MELRPYQQEAKDAIFEQWDNGVKKNSSGSSDRMRKDSRVCKSDRGLCASGKPRADPRPPGRAA